MNLPAYAKAIVGSLVAGLGSLQQALDDNAVSPKEWVAVAVAALLGLGIVAVVPNRPAAQPERGAGELRSILIVFAGVVLALIVWGLLISPAL